MKTIYKIIPKIILFLMLALVVCSCQKVINIDLNSASPKIVIDANISDQPGPYIVTLSQTINFSQDNLFPPVTGAHVVITDNVGNTDVLKEVLPGKYQTSTLQGTPGRTYTLSVTANGINYSAVSTMPAPVAIDQIASKNRFNSAKNKVITIDFLDPKGIDNYYHIVEKVTNIVPVNGNIQIPTLGSVTNDRLSDGTEINYTSGGNQPDLAIGDTVIVSLQCVDINVYNYFRTAEQNGSSSTTLSNPVTNITNGALGYFSAYAVRSKTIIIQ